MTPEPDSTNSLQHPAETAKIPAENAVHITSFSWWPRTIRGSVVVIALLGAVLWQPEHRLYGVVLAFFLIAGSCYLWFSLTVPADQKPKLKWWRTPGSVAALVCVVLGISGPAVLDHSTHRPDKLDSSFTPNSSFSAYLEKLERAAANGDGQAAYKLGRLYHDGARVGRDMRKAFAWFQKGATNGDRDAQADLGMMYNSGRGVQQDKAKAEECYIKLFAMDLKAAESGVAKAQAYVAKHYEVGEGVAKDEGKAEEWYRRAVKSCQEAASLGDAEAEYALGYMYGDGKGVRQDAGLSLDWYESAAAHGSLLAQQYLAMSFSHEWNPKKDYAKAFRWYYTIATSASERVHDIDNAQLRVADCYAKGKGTSKDEAQAFSWYQKLAENGVGQGQMECANILMHGKGGPIDVQQAFQWYLRAAEWGENKAMEIVADMYEAGIGTAKDESKASSWYGKALAVYQNEKATDSFLHWWTAGVNARQHSQNSQELTKETLRLALPPKGGSFPDVWESEELLVNSTPSANDEIVSVHYSWKVQRDAQFLHLLALHAFKHSWRETPPDPQDYKGLQEQVTQRRWVRTDGKLIATYPMISEDFFPYGLWIRSPEENLRERERKKSRR